MSNGYKVVNAYMKSRDPPIAHKNHSVEVAAKLYIERPHMAKAMEEMKARAQKRIEKVYDKYAITEEKIAEEIAKLAFTNLTDVIEWDKDGVRVKSSSDLPPEVRAAISEVIETGDDEKGRTIRIKMFDKKSALELLAKYKGMMVDRRETTNKNVNISFIIDKTNEKKVIDVGPEHDQVLLPRLPDDKKI